jgi:hypothetical protein
MGVKADSADHFTIYAEGHGGAGEITGLNGHSAMALAIMLARCARSHDVPWPSGVHTDPWEAATIAAMRQAVQEDALPAFAEEEDAVIDTVLDELAKVESRINAAMRALAAVEHIIRDSREPQDAARR